MLTIKRFTATWCGPCKQLGPIFADLKTEHQDVNIMTIDVDQQQEEAQKYAISSVPTVVFEKDGQPVERIIGLKPKALYTAKIAALK